MRRINIICHRSSRWFFQAKSAMSSIGRFCCKSRHTDGAGRLMPFVEAVRCHPLDCAGRLTLDFTDACNVTQSTQGRVVVAGRPTSQACEGSAQSLPT